MSGIEIIFGVILLVFAVGIILVVLLQEGNQQGVGVINGGAESFYGKNKGRTIDAFLARWTKFIAVVFFVMVIVLNALIFFVVK